jgi:cobalt/nickel transport system permease protein
MVNFPIAAGTSGHLVGGAMAGMLLGPWAGLLSMSAVLIVQAVVFGDGGIFALGANVLNMGVIGVAVGAAVERLLVAPRAKSAGSLLTRASAAALAGWLSIVLAALACAIEMAVSGAASAGEVVTDMLGVHALIGLAEAAITALVVTVGAYGAAHWPRQSAAHERYGFSTILLPVIIVVALAPFASPLPDGLESVAERLRSLELRDTATIPSVFADYAIPGIAWLSAATILAGMLGVALVYGVAALGCLGVRRNRGTTIL